MTRQLSKSAGDAPAAITDSIPSARTVVIRSVRNTGIKLSIAAKPEKLAENSGKSFLTL